MTIQPDKNPPIRQLLFSYEIAVQAADNHRKAQGILFDSLPEYMKEIRKVSRRMTQKQLANVLEVDHSSISKIESGHLQPGMEFVAKLCNYVIENGLS